MAQEYLGTAEGSLERSKLEQQFGRVLIRRLISQYEEEKANLQWLIESTMKCPGCRCYVEKNMGCNHVRFMFRILNGPLNVVVDEMLEVFATLLLSLWDATGC